MYIYTLSFSVSKKVVEPVTILVRNNNHLCSEHQGQEGSVIVNDELLRIWTEVGVGYYPRIYLQGLRYMSLLLDLLVYTYMDEQTFA